MSNVAQAVAAKRAVLFDLFHTLTGTGWSADDGPPTHVILGVPHEAWREQTFEHSRARWLGDITDPHDIIRRMAHAIDPTVPDAAIARAVAVRKERFARGLLTIPACNLDALAALGARGKRLALVSNADVTEVEAWERCPAARHFHAAVFSCHARCAKPDREIYEQAMREIGVAPCDCVFVGDGGSDELAGARALGIVTVMMTGVIRAVWPAQIEARRADADFMIDSLSELLA